MKLEKFDKRGKWFDTHTCSPAGCALKENLYYYSPWQETDCVACECRRRVCPGFTAYVRNYIAPSCFNSIDSVRRSKWIKMKGQKEKKKAQRDSIKSVGIHENRTTKCLGQLGRLRKRKRSSASRGRARVSTFIQLTRHMFRKSKLICSSLRGTGKYRLPKS